MPTVTYTVEDLCGRVVVTWAGLANDDDGSPFFPPGGYDLESVQFTGTLGTTPTLTVQGSNQQVPSTYASLGTASALGAVIPSGQTRHFRPLVNGGSGSTITAIAYFQAR